MSGNLVTTRRRPALATLVAAFWFPALACAQASGGGHDHHPAQKPASGTIAARARGDSQPGGDMVGMADHAMTTMTDVSMLHMTMTPKRPATRADSARAMVLAAEIRGAIEKYRDTTAAVADGFKMFMPNVKHQKTYHFTNYKNAFIEAFRFDPAKPTSILYKPGADGKLELVGAMYTAPKRMGADKLDGRIPLGIARWHLHTNWCVPKKGETARWLERRDGKPLFGPESQVATKDECDAISGDFHDSIFGWMTHVNVFAGTDLASIFGDDHAHGEMADHMR